MLSLEVKYWNWNILFFVFLLIFGSGSTIQVPNVSIESVGLFPNEAYEWSTNVTSITIKYTFSYEGIGRQESNSTETEFRVMFDRHTNAHELDGLSISPSSCKVGNEASQPDSLYLDVKCDNYNRSSFEMNLTISRPSINLDGEKILLKFPPYTSNVVLTKALRIKQCPLNFQNDDLQAVDVNSKSTYDYKDTVYVRCKKGLLLTTNSGQIGLGSSKGEARTCGPYAEWEKPALQCWKGAVITINKKANHHLDAVASKPILIRCNNNDPANIENVQLRIGKSVDQYVTSRKVALKKIKLAVTSPKAPLNLQCVENYRNGNQKILHVFLHVFKHGTRFLNRKSKFRVDIGYKALIEILITSPTPVTIHQINITKRGVHVDNFKLQHFKYRGSVQLIVMEIEKATIHDTGNYTITITSNDGEITRTHIEVQGVVHRVSKSMLAGVIAGSLILVLIILAVIVVFIIRAKKYRKLHSDHSDSDQDIVMNVEETNVDNVFSPNPDQPHSSEMRLMSTSITTRKNNDSAKPSNGLLGFPQNNDIDRVSVNTETSNAQNDDVFVADTEISPAV